MRKDDEMWLLIGVLLAAALLLLTGCVTPDALTIGTRREAGASRVTTQSKSIRIELNNVAIPAGHHGPIVAVAVGSDNAAEIPDTNQSGATIEPDSAVATGAGSVTTEPEK